ncbi:MAG: PqqD family protein [Armatimonadetes bacterium]|nr:PqqD family protein [Armatimonadota bacterium]
MSLIGTLQKYLPFGGKPTLPRGETLALRPVRNRAVTWESLREEEPSGDEEAAGETEGGVRLIVPRRQDRLGRFLGRVFPVPNQKTIELDEFGAEVWQMCDGAHTVEQLVTHTCGKYKLNRRQGEVSVIAFMKMLAQRRLIGFLTKETVKEKERPHANHNRPQRQRRAGRARRRH